MFSLKKTISIITIFIVTTYAQAPNSINNYSLDEAVKLSNKTLKKTLVYIYTDWCSYCEIMEQVHFKFFPVVKYINDNFYFVAINTDKIDTISFQGIIFVKDSTGKNPLINMLLKDNYKYPAFVVINEKGEILSRIYGYLDKEEFLAYLRFINEERYRDYTWNDYKKIALGK